MAAGHGGEATVKRVLLPDNVVPSYYKLAIEPDLEKFTFDGHAEITVTVAAATQSVVLHAQELSVAEVVFRPANGGKELSATTLTYDLGEKTLSIHFGEELPLGEGILVVDYVGQLNNQMAGFYRSSYVASNGEKRIMASTQFEALDARRAFPCWDEPARKAVFNITLTVPVNRHAFSNMPEAESCELGNGKKRISYMDSPKMSTYLVAFCVGEFDFVQARTKHGVLVRVYTPPGKSKQGTFSLDCATRTLDFYDDYFDIPYPLPKLDMVAIPEFAMGAMENWGLVTYREVDVLIDPLMASSQQLQRVCTVVTHELAHQWFGNLVTMQWWDDLWLNEGFACWMQTAAADHLFPEWKLWDQWVTDDQSAALRLDAMRTSHPIQVPIGRAQEVEEVFDAISYCKGSCVVRLLFAILGEEAFRKGLQIYMKRHQYGNTETFNLWQAWSEASGKPIGDIMNTWTLQMGFPLLSVIKTVWTTDACEVLLEQSWFLADGSQDSTREKVWQFPVLAGGSGLQPREPEMMSGRSITVRFPRTSGVAEGLPWIKLNFGQFVPARVLYPENEYPGLCAAMSSRAMPPGDRAGLVLDSYNLSKAGLLSPARVVELLASCVDDEDVTVWNAVSSVLVAFDTLLLDEPTIHVKLRDFASKLIAKIAAKVGWEATPTDEIRTKLLRANIVSLHGRFSDKEPTVLAEARKRFEAVCADPADPTACVSDFRVPVFKIVLRASKDEEEATRQFRRLQKVYEQLDSDADRKPIMHALGAVPYVKLQRETLEWAISGAVKLQDLFYPILSVSSASKEGLDLAWQFLRDNFRKLRSMYQKASPSLMSAVIFYSCGSFTSNERADEIEAFFKANPLPDNERKIAQMLESIRTNAIFVSRFQSTELNPAKSVDFWANLL